MHYFLSILSGLMLIFCFPAWDMGWLAWVSLVPLFIAFEGKEPSKGFAIAFLTGLVFFSGSIYWIKIFHPLALPLSILYLSLYLGLFGFFACRLKVFSSRINFFLLALLWVSIEYVRSLGYLGFPWFTMGYTQYKYLSLIQISQFFGVWGVSFLIILFNASLAKCLINRKCEKHFIVIMVLLAFVFVWGKRSVKNSLKGFNKELNIAVVQGNFDIFTVFSTEEILSRLSPMSLQAVQNNKIDLVIWTETVILEDARNNESLKSDLIRLASELDAHLLLGNPTYQRVDGDIKHFNSALLISPGGEVYQYNKMHLVPFGEYVPGYKKFGFMKKFAEFIESGEYDPGEKFTLLDLKKGKFGTLVCFEGIFGNLTRKFVKKSADFLVNITEDDWLKNRSGMEQHAYMSVFRAVENKVYYIRAGNSGLSLIITPGGEIIGRMPIQTQGYFIGKVRLKKGTKTFYTKHGDVFVRLVLIATIGLAIGSFVAFRKNP